MPQPLRSATSSSRFRRLGLTAALLTLAPAAPALAVPLVPVPQELPLRTVFDGAMSPTAGQSSKACQAAYRPGAPGVATREISVTPGIGLLELTMTGTGGDADVAVFDTAGNPLAAAASPDAQETAAGWTSTGGTLRLQVCQADGDSKDVRVKLERAGLPADARSAKADPPQLVEVKAPTLAERNRVAELGLDLAEGASDDSIAVLVHNAADRTKLTRAGLEFEVVVPDLIAQDLEARRADTRFAARAARADVPSGRTTYRRLADYETDLKALADANPGLVKLITLKNKTLGGHDVMGVEITTDVNVERGKPAFLNMGVHHAREWPSGEHAMEWAIELVNGFKSGDARITKIVQQSRNIVVPIVNPDGFEASRTAGNLGGADGGRDENAQDDTTYFVAGTFTGGEYRRKNCRLPDDSNDAQCLTSSGIAETGVDPNRNYGGLWGGPGADTNPATQTYRGKGPFSELETQNIKDLVGTRNIMTLITNHTTAGLVLRAPGIAALGDPVDENRGYKALGDAMALENGYFSQKSFELYDTTGTTEDWTYNTAGGFGFTFEIYCGDPNYETGDCDDPAFHPRYERVVEEYNGTSPQADHKADPGRSAENPFGNVKNYDGQGNSEAYKMAAESAIDESRHAILSGTAPAGATLRLKKTFETETFPQPQPDGSTKPDLFPDSLTSNIQVDDSGNFRWHVNPSTRPIVAQSRGEEGGGTPSPEETQTGGLAGSPSDPNADGATVPAATLAPDAPVTSASYNDHPITVPATGDNRAVNVRVAWTTPSTDYDIALYEDTNENGRSDEGEPQVSSSAQGATAEEIVSDQLLKTEAGKKYVLRVINFAAAENYTVTITYSGPEPFQPAKVEAYTLTCEVGGQVLDTQQVIIDRGQAKGLTLGGGCASKSAAGTSPGTPITPGTGSSPAPSSPGTGTPLTPSPTTPKAGGGKKAKACVAGGGFRSVGLRRKGRRVQVLLARKIKAKAQVSIFQQSVGRKITGERLVARFSNRTKSFTWNGKANRKGRTVRNGYFIVRFSVGAGAKRDVRRLVLERRKGRFVRRASYFRRGTCDVLPRFKVERPVFGGATNRPLNVSFRLASAAKVTVIVSRGRKVLKRFGPTQRRASVTQRLRLGAKGLGKGDYRISISVPRKGQKPLVTSLTARRL